jgi:hypothetical protein
MVQELRSLEIGECVGFRQIGVSGRIWTLKPLLKELWSKSEYKDLREFYNLSNDGESLEF